MLEMRNMITLEIRSEQNPDAPTVGEHIGRIRCALTVSFMAMKNPGQKRERLINAMKRIAHAEAELTSLGQDPAAYGLTEEYMTKIRRSINEVA